jgi:hypothetical protein
VSKKGGGESNEEEEWGAWSLSKNWVAAQAIRRHVTLAQTLIVKVVTTPFPLGMDHENVPK